MISKIVAYAAALAASVGVLYLATDHSSAAAADAAPSFDKAFFISELRTTGFISGVSVHGSEITGVVFYGTSYQPGTHTMVVYALVSMASGKAYIGVTCNLLQEGGWTCPKPAEIGTNIIYMHKH